MMTGQMNLPEHTQFFSKGCQLLALNPLPDDHKTILGVVKEPTRGSSHQTTKAFLWHQATHRANRPPGTWRNSKGTLRGFSRHKRGSKCHGFDRYTPAQHP